MLKKFLKFIENVDETINSNIQNYLFGGKYFKFFVWFCIGFLWSFRIIVLWVLTSVLLFEIFSLFE